MDQPGAGWCGSDLNSDHVAFINGREAVQRNLAGSGNTCLQIETEGVHGAVNMPLVNNAPGQGSTGVGTPVFDEKNTAFILYQHDFHALKLERTFVTIVQLMKFLQRVKHGVVSLQFPLGYL